MLANLDRWSDALVSGSRSSIWMTNWFFLVASSTSCYQKCWNGKMGKGDIRPLQIPEPRQFSDSPCRVVKPNCKAQRSNRSRRHLRMPYNAVLKFHWAISPFRRGLRQHSWLWFPYHTRYLICHGDSKWICLAFTSFVLDLSSTIIANMFLR